MAQMKKPASKKVSNGSNTKPYNVKLMTPGELVGGKGTKKPAPKKPMAPRKPTTGVKKPMAKTLTGPAAVEALQKRVSPSGVKKAEMDAKKATNKKYPGLYKKSK
jgi:hypothetical protein